MIWVDEFEQLTGAQFVSAAYQYAQTFKASRTATITTLGATLTANIGFDPGVVTISLKNVDGSYKPGSITYGSGTVIPGPGTFPPQWFYVNITPYQISSGSYYSVVISVTAGGDIYTGMNAADAYGSDPNVQGWQSTDYGVTWVGSGGLKNWWDVAFRVGAPEDNFLPFFI
jgi:hypothetical protein